MSEGEGDRGVHMGRRVARTAGERGMEDGSGRLLERLHEVAMEPRRAALPDDHDPAFLHPGRTVLILLLDAGARELPLLAAALLVDSERPDLEPDPGRVAPWAEAVGAGPALAAALELAADLPRPGDEALAEKLVVGSEALRLLSLAERLDQLRHVHLWEDAAAARTAWEGARDVYLPVAERTHPVLHRRYAWWCRTFPRRRG